MSAHVARATIERLAEQIGSELDVDTDLYVNRFLVESTTSSAMYRVSQKRSDGTWCCSCKQWTMRPDKVTGKRKCKHLTDILRRLAELPAAAITDAEAVKLVASARSAYLDLGGTAPLAVERPTTTRALDL